MTDLLLGGHEAWDENARALSTMLRAQGLSDDDVRQILSTEGFTAKMAALFLTARPGAKSATTPEIAALIPKGWTLIEDVPSRLFQVRELGFISFLQSGEEYVGGETMRARAVKLEGNFGLADAAFMIENQQLIPSELRCTAYIAFPGTVVCDSGGLLSVPYLGWLGEQWILYFDWLDFNWHGSGRLVSCK